MQQFPKIHQLLKNFFQDPKVGDKDLKSWKGKVGFGNEQQLYSPRKMYAHKKKLKKKCLEFEKSSKKFASCILVKKA